MYRTTAPQLFDLTPLRRFRAVVIKAGDRSPNGCCTSISLAPRALTAVHAVGQSTDVDLNPPWKRCRSTMYKKYSDSARRWGPLRPRKTRRRVRFGCRTNERTNALVCVTWSVGPTHDASSNHRPGLDCGYVGSMVGRAASFG
ncbi:hypothetical protein GW17_00018463 [Ensete ventricosum]|nr:hypothetical protein GW17_00018463 [Ensete ventricosum]